MRVFVAIIVLTICLTGILSIFWKEELHLALPTPVPPDYKEIPVGTPVSLPLIENEKNIPYFIHFYNPDCPCARFNAPHVQSIIQKHGNRVKAMVIIPHIKYMEEARKEIGSSIDIRVDDGGIAKACGVYSTPQAAIIDEDGKLYYRGNYNKARYCTGMATNFAELSLVALLNGQPPPSYGLQSTQPYGCGLFAKTDQDIEFF